MADNEKERLFKRLIRSVSHERLLERLRATGFWPHNRPLPPDPPEEAAERAALQKEASELSRERALTADSEAALALFDTAIIVAEPAETLLTGAPARALMVAMTAVVTALQRWHW